MVKTTTRWLLAGLLCLALWPATAHAQLRVLVLMSADSFDTYYA